MKSIYLLTICCFYMVSANAGLEDFRPGTWNLQGTSDSTENKWQTHIRPLLLRSNNNDDERNILAVQEVTGPPASATVITSGPDYIQVLRPDGDNHVVHQYQWRVSTSRMPPESVYLYLVEVAQRVNLGIITVRRPDHLVLLRSPRSGYQSARPILGAVYDSNTQEPTAFYSIHAISAGDRSDAHDIVRSVYNYNSSLAQRVQWMIMGDFNLEPDILETRLRSPRNNLTPLDLLVEIVHPEIPTQGGRRIYDYAVLSSPTLAPNINLAAAFLVTTTIARLGSDHVPVNFNCE